MTKSHQMFLSLMKKCDKLADDMWTATTAKRITVIIPAGVKIWDSDLGVMFIGDGSTYGGRINGSKEAVRLVVTAAASAFTCADTFKTITASSSGVFTCSTHGYVVGDRIVAMSTTDATYGLTQDTVYTIATRPDANSFTLTGVTPTNQTANYVVKKYNTAVNNYVTWAQGAYLRTGDAVTAAANGGTLPTGISATTYYVVKNDDASNGGYDNNTSTSFKLSDSRVHALAGTNTLTIRADKVGSPTLVTVNAYATPACKTIAASTAVATDIFLPDAATVTGREYRVSNAGAAAATVKAVGGTVDNVAAGTGRVLKANSFDFIDVISDGTNWVAVSKQITA